MTKGIVIGGSKFGEADSILRILTPDKGRVSAYARGVRKGNSKFSGCLEPMMLNSFLLAEGRNMATVCQVENLKSFNNIRSDYSLIIHGTNFLEAARKLTEEGLPDPPCFGLLLGALEALESGFPPTGVELVFKVGLLHAQGVFPDMSGCGSCSTKKTKAIHFDGRTMSLMCDSCATSAGIRNVVDRDTLTGIHLAASVFNSPENRSEDSGFECWESAFDGCSYPETGTEEALMLADEMLSAFLQARVGRAGRDR